MNLSVHAVSRFDFVLKEIIKFQEYRQEFHENYKEKLKKEVTEIKPNSTPKLSFYLIFNVLGAYLEEYS